MIYEAPVSVLENLNSDVIGPSNGGSIVLPDDSFNG